MYDVREIRRRIEDKVAKIGSERGQEVINNDETHVTEIWEDGEVTSTKSGELFRQRSLHQRDRPFINVEGMNPALWDIPEDKDHTSRVVVDDEALDIIAEYRNLTVNQKLIELAEKEGL